ncbi:histidine kinase, partial [bacterium]|nr:histidine kinase [bacterium]
MKKSLLIIFLIIITKIWSINSNFDTYSVLDGLSNSSIKAIYQDKLGFMWFGTKDGLNRFDGIEFKTYRFEKNKSNSLYYNDITCIKPDLSGNLWIGTFEGIMVFDTET